MPRSYRFRVESVNSHCAIVVDYDECMDRTALVSAIERVQMSARDNASRLEVMTQRLQLLRNGVEGGAPVADLVRDADPPIVQLLTDNLEELQQSGVEFRYALAAALVEEGMSAADVARIFGVSRQRVSALLNDARRGSA